MNIRCRIAVLEDILAGSRTALGKDVDAYRHHCYRVFNFCCAFSGVSLEDEKKIAIASAFHDLGIWEFGTFDYLAGSRELARDYLARQGLSAWAPEIEAMIDGHHKITRDRRDNARLVEAFRKADWTDVSLGTLRFGLPRRFVAETRAALPNLGFHRMLAQLTIRRLRSHPFSPLPMMKI